MPGGSTPMSRPSPQAASGSVRRPALVLVTCILASSLSFVDGSVVNVALPHVAGTLGRSLAGVQWVVDAYMLPLSGLLLLGGAAGDRWGRRRLLILGVGLFAAASLGCALAPSLPALVLMRGVQGVGAACLLPASLATLAATFQGAARGAAVGTWGAAGGAAAAAGPVLGGWLTDSFGWRAVFLVNLPLALAAIALAATALPKGEPAGEGRRFDAPGALLATAGLGLVAWGLTLGAGPRGWGLASLACLAAGVGLLAAFVVVERGRGETAMAPPDLFASRPFLGLSLLTILVYGALGAVLVLLPYYLQRQYGWTSLQAGLAFLPVALSLVAGGPAAGALAGRIGPRPLLTAGPLLAGLGFALLLRTGGDEARYVATLLPGLACLAVGMALTAAPLTTAVLASVPAPRAGTASGLNSALARTGGLIGTALLGRVLGAPPGPALVAAFHAAVVAAAAACLLAAVAAATLLEKGPAKAQGRA